VLPALGAEQTVLPPASVLGELQTQLPHERFHDEADGGRQSDLVALGNMAFESPQIFGDPARKAGISCGTCHVGGDINPVFFIPGLSDRPGGLAVVNAFFNPRTDNGLHRHIDIPSLRGIRYMAPYGRDGRIASLREFTRNVIVNEFNGPEPSPRLVDAITAYMEQIDFLPNSKLGPDGRLTEAADEAARRGEAAFSRTFPQMGGDSCASCHQPMALFIDHQQHDIGSGGGFDTPTLLDAAYTAPYFHDGRFADFGQVVGYFDDHFKLGLTAAEKVDLVAYLTAVGEAENPFDTATPDLDVDELMVFSRALDRAIAEQDRTTIDIGVGTIAREMREIQEHFPGPSDPIGMDQQALLKPARGAAGRLVIQLRRVQTAAESGDFDRAAEALAAFRKGAEEARPIFAAAVPVSLYNPDLAAKRLALIAQLNARLPAAQ
jgi:cytochrome c peroxidase